MPKLMLQALQVNVNGGRLLPPEDNGRRCLKIPIDFFAGNGNPNSMGMS